jgi:hypothetical protein
VNEFTVAEKLRSIERELRLRQRVYPRLIARGEMSEANAQREIAVLEAIAADYRRHRDTGDLFEAVSVRR